MASVLRRLPALATKRHLLSHCAGVNRRVSCHRLRALSTEAKQQEVSGAQSMSATNGLALSESCVKQLKKIAGPGECLRVSVEGGGCSGFQYKFDVGNTINADDKIFERQGAKVVVDEVSLEYINGSVVDYHEELIRCSFRILNNPMAEQGCSCGVSFAIK